nr:fructose-specific PTS transporter subunit EIIC [Lachnospiraceae bacterium]
MRITDLLKPEGIKLGGSASSKQDAINQMVDLMVKEGNISDKEKYKAAVFAREQESTTAVGEGIAIPHAKTDAVKAPGLAAMTVPDGVDYDSPDGEPSNLIFLIAAPNTKENVHLEVLSRLSTLLMDDDFTAKLRAAKTPAEFRKIVDDTETEKLAEEDAKAKAAASGTNPLPSILAITACPTGIAHTYMAAENLEKKAKEMGILLKAETQGSVGAKNVLTQKEIDNCDGIIIAADKNIDLGRFDGKPVYVTSVSKGINEPEVLINKIVNKEVPIFHAAGGKVAAASGEKDSTWHIIYKHLMNGVSHMLPFVVGGGILIALAFLSDNVAIGTSNYGMGTPLAAFFKTVGGAAFGFMLPILAGFIAMSIADRPGLAVGFVGGALASSGYTFAYCVDQTTPLVSAGFIGALIAGFIGGFVVLGLEKLFDKLPKSLEGIKPVLLYPFFGILIIGFIMFLINPVMAAINTGISNWLTSLGTGSKVLMGVVLGGMMSVDMGGPINKAAYVFGTAQLASQSQVGYEIMAAVMVGGMVPPLVIAFSTTFFKNRWTKEERNAGIVNYIMAASFISEGAIPFAAGDPIRVLPSCIVGSAIAGAISIISGCASRAPHGGLWVIGIISNPVMFIIALLAGSVVGCLILSFLKKPLPPEQSG